MSKFDLLNEVLTLKETESYIEDVFDELETIYEMDEPPKGKKGAIWRTIWGRPYKGTPLAYYLSLKLIEEIKNNNISVKEARKLARTKERVKVSKLMNGLQDEVSVLSETNEELEIYVEKISDENEKLSSDLESNIDEKETIEKEFESFKKRIETGEQISNDVFVKDIRMLYERLIRWEDVKLDELGSVRKSKIVDDNNEV
jgi:predicted RNase H-like nuclease (RuvC/YqgF family)